MKLAIGNKAENIQVFILLALLVLFHAGNNLIWIGRNRLPNYWGEAVELNRELSVCDILRKDGVAGAKKVFTGELYYYRPVLFSAFVFLSVSVFGKTYPVMSLTTTFFLVILLLVVYAAGAIIGGKKTGVLSAVIVSLYPMVYGFSRANNLEIPLMAWVALSVYIFLLSRRFERLSFSLLFGAALGLGLLLDRLVCLIFTAGIIVYVFCGIAADFLNKESPENNTFRRAVNLASAMLAAFLIAFPYYSAWLPRNFGYVTGRAWGAPELWFGWYYLLGLAFLMSPFFLAVFLAGIVMVFKWENKYKAVLLVWIIVPYVFFSSVRYKEPQFLGPLLPACAIISAAGIMRLKREGLRVCVIAAVILSGLGAFFSPSAETPGGNSGDECWAASGGNPVYRKQRCMEVVYQRKGAMGFSPWGSTQSFIKESRDIFKGFDLTKGIVLVKRPEKGSREFLGFLAGFKGHANSAMGIIDHIPRSSSLSTLSDEGLAFLLRIRNPGSDFSLCNICDPLDKNNNANIDDFFSGRKYDYVFYLTAGHFDFSAGRNSGGMKFKGSDALAASREVLVSRVLNGIRRDLSFHSEVPMSDGSVMYVFKRGEELI